MFANQHSKGRLTLSGIFGYFYGSVTASDTRLGCKFQWVWDLSAILWYGAYAIVSFQQYRSSSSLVTRGANLQARMVDDCPLWQSREHISSIVVLVTSRVLVTSSV